MKQITEKQIVEWKAELNVQKQKKVQAEQALDEITRTILMIEGGIQFGEIALKKRVNRPAIRYSGARPITRQNVIKVKGVAIFNRISFSIMFQKICQIASLLSLFLTLSMLGGSYYAYRFVTSEQFKARVMNEVLDNVQGLMPKVLDNNLPKMTGPSLPIPSKKIGL